MWCSTVRGERDRRVAISALRLPAATSSRISSSRAVRPAAFARVVARGPRGTRANARARASGGARARRAGGAERVEDRQRRALRRLVAVGERARLLVRAAERLPRRARPPPAAFDLQRETARRKARADRDPTPARQRQNASSPRNQGWRLCARQREARDRPRRRRRRSPVEPGSSARAAATGASRCNVPLDGERERLVERLGRAGVAAARAQAAERDQGDDAVGRAGGLALGEPHWRARRRSASGRGRRRQRLPALHVAGEAIEVVARAKAMPSSR